MVGPCKHDYFLIHNGKGTAYDTGRCIRQSLRPHD
jgi:hypothetical protein